MAQSQPEAEIKFRGGKPRDPYRRYPVTVECDPEEGRTHQSFALECDVNYILDQFGRTGVLPHGETREKQYGDVPDISFHEAMVAKAEMNSAIHDGYEPPEAAEDPPEADPAPEDPAAEKSSQEPVEAPEKATEG